MIDFKQDSEYKRLQKLWTKKVTVPVLLKQADKILGAIDVKLKKRSKDVR